MQPLITHIKPLGGTMVKGLSKLTLQLHQMFKNQTQLRVLYIEYLYFH